MDQFARDVYIDEALMKCDFAKIAYWRFRHFGKMNDEAEAEQEHLPVAFESLYGFLQHVSGLSLIFWPSPAGKGTPDQKKNRLSRGAELRGICGIPENHPLGERTFRDHLAHLDERIDAWLAESTNQNFQRFIWEERGGIGNFASTDVFECYVIGEDQFLFRGSELNVGQTWKHVCEIRKLIFPHSRDKQFADKEALFQANLRGQQA